MYPEPTNIWQSIEYSSLGIGIAESLWAFPTIESLHVMALVTVLGTLLVMDLRMLGLASSAVPIRKVSDDTLKWTWMAFVVAAITGTLLFISKASTYMVNPYFLTKMGLMALAGVNMLFFHFVTYKTVDQWDSATSPPAAVKFSAALSLLIWVIIVFCGRAIGFTLGIYTPY